MAVKPYVEPKFKELQMLMSNLKAVQNLDYAQCKKIYKRNKTDVKNDIYSLIAEVASR